VWSLTGRCGVLGLVLLGTGVCACSTPSDPVPQVSETPTEAVLPAVDCSISVRAGPLPAWARAGFSDDGASFRHVEGVRGLLAGVLFGYPLSSPPAGPRRTRSCGSRGPVTGRLRISAQLEGSGPVVEREVGFGGGQSIVDLPHAGCWRLTLRWGDDLTDVVDLPYVASPR
jgi:hypothetical protein